MAIFHLSSKLIKRSKGQNIIETVANRLGGILFDERLNTTYNFTKYKGLYYAKILAPSDSPEWITNRETLWNAVEKAEKRHDAQLAREIDISLPVELNNDKNIELVTEFAIKNFVDKGMIADIFIHGINRDNPHAHIMLTMRHINHEGFGNKNLDWNKKEYLFKWRENWAKLVNSYLALAGFDITINHRSFKDQGIPLEPQPKLGPLKNMPYHKAMETDRMQEYLSVRRRNGEKIKTNPEIAFLIIALSKATFTEKDIKGIAKTYSADHSQFTEVFNAIINSNYLLSLEFEKKGQERVYKF